MPINGTLQPWVLTPATQDEGPPLLDTFGAAFLNGNATVGLARAAIAPHRPYDPEFKPLDHLTDSEILSTPQLAGATSLAELRDMREDLRRRSANDRILARAGATGWVAALAAAVVDPVAWPVEGLAGRAVAGAATVARMGRVARLATTGAAVGASGAAAQEAGLQATQADRTATESLANIAAGAIFGGALGAGAGALGRKALAGTLADIERQAAGESAGAAHYQPLLPEDSEIAPTGIGIERVLGTKAGAFVTSPGVRIAQSPFAAMREAAMRLAPLGVRTKGDMAGKAMPQAAQIHARARTDAALARQQRAENVFYSQRQDRAMSEADFWSEVTRANRRGDVHADPSIQQAARWWRENVYDPRKVEAQGLGLLPDELKVRGAKGYAPRDIDFVRLQREPGAFRAAIRNWLTGSGVPRDVADDLAEDLADSIRRSPAGRLPTLKLRPGVATNLRERALNVPDEVLEPWLENDARVLGERYTRTMVTEVEMSRAFGGLPPEKALDDALNKIDDEARTMIEGRKDTAEKLRARAEEDKETLRQIFDRVRGTDARGGNPQTFANRTFRTIGNVVPTQMLGTVTLSSLTDASSIVFQHGLARVAGASIKNFAGGFRVLRKGGIARAELEKAGVGLEVVGSSIRSAKWDTGTIERVAGPIERGSARLNDAFFKLTLLNQWTDTMSRYAGLMSTQRVLDSAEALAKGGKLSRFDTRQLAAAGLDDAMLRRIAKERANWQSDLGFRFGNVDAWADREAVHAFEGAVAHGSTMAIMTPGAADVPFWVSGAGRRLIYQFQSFASTFTSRVMVAGLQRRDAAMLNGWMLMTALGAGATALKDVANYGDVKDRTAAEWTAEAVDRSGLATTVFQANNALATFGLGVLPGTSRFAEREGLATRALGPAVGQAERVRKLALTTRDLLAGEELTQADAKNAIRLLPFQNLWVMRQVLDKAVEKLPERQSR